MPPAKGCSSLKDQTSPRLRASQTYSHELHAHCCHRTYGSGRQRPDRASAARSRNDRARPTQLDISERDAVLAALRAAWCDVIINAAAYTAVDKAESEAEVAMRVNGEGAGFVAEIAAELGVPLLHLSTDYVFDGALDRPYREDDPPKPAGAYGRSKLIGEQRIAAIHPDHCGARTSACAWSGRS